MAFYPEFLHSAPYALLGTISLLMYLSNSRFLPSPIFTKTLLGTWDSFEEHFFWGLLVGIPILVLFSTATYFYIERPFLDLRKSYVR